MAQQQQQQQQPPPPGPASNAHKPPIPPLVSISPSIFTPIQGDDLLLPFTAPTSRIDRLYAELEALETNRRNVRANMLSLYRRECARLIQDAQADEKAERDNSGAQEEGDGRTVCRPSEEDLEALIANMMAEPEGERPVPLSVACAPDFANFTPRSRREYWTTQIEITIGKGLRDLKGYEDHVASTRNMYTEALGREMQISMDIDSS